MAAEGQGSHNRQCGLTSLVYTAWSNLGIVPPLRMAIFCSSRICAPRLSPRVPDS